jgi:iron(III) transport system substrate-binding protein
MKKISRRFFAGAALATALAFAAPCFAQQQMPDPKDEAELYRLAKAEGELNWYQTSPLPPMQAVAGAFQKKYPGIKVQVLRLLGPQQYARFMQETEAKQHIADSLFMGDFPSMQKLINAGHIAEWKVPTRDRVPDDFAVGNFAYAPIITDIAIIYNVNKLTPEEVEILRAGWEGVLDPRFKGRFTVSTQKCGGCYAPLHMFLDPKFKDKFGPEFVKKIAAQKPAIFSDFQVIIDRVVAGEKDFAFWSAGASAIERFERGQPIRWVQPSPTPAWGNSWQGVSKYAPHPAAARLFQNWIMSEDGARAMQDLYGSVTTLKDYPDTRAITKQPWYKPMKEEYRMDWARWEQNFNKDMDFYINSLKEAQ